MIQTTAKFNLNQCKQNNAHAGYTAMKGNAGCKVLTARALQANYIHKEGLIAVFFMVQ